MMLPMSVKNIFNALQLKGTLDSHGAGGETCLTRAVKMGLVDVAEDFLKLGADPDRENAHGETPIFIALAQRDRAMMVALVQNGASIFMRQNGLTFKEQAMKQNMPDVAAWADRIERDRLATMAVWFPC